MHTALNKHALLAFSLLVWALTGCQLEGETTWPPRAPCEPSTGPVVDTVTFPPRDRVCADGAATPCPLTVPLHSDEARTVDVSAELDGATFSYLVSHLALPEATRRSGDVASGIGADFDGLDSGFGSTLADATCEEFGEDHASAVEPGVTGIDNVFEALIGTMEGLMDSSECPAGMGDGCIDARLSEDLRAGRLLMIVEVTGVDSFEHDPEVNVAMYAVRTTDGSPPALDGDVIAAGQELETVATLAAPSTGSILHGRLEASWSELSLPRERFGYPEQLTRPRLRAAICERGLFHGYLAALTPVEAMVEQWTGERAPLGGRIDAETARNVLQAVADVSPSAEDPTVCEHISLAYAVEAVPATRRP